MARDDSNIEVKKGTQFRAVIADSNALWEVKSRKGSDAWLCEVVDEPVVIDGKTYRGDYAGQQDVFLESKIRQSLGMSRLFNNLGDERRAAAEALCPGDIVYIRKSADCYIKCEVVPIDSLPEGVDVPANNQGDTTLKAIALVGAWRSECFFAPHGERQYVDYFVGRFFESIRAAEAKDRVVLYPNTSPTTEIPAAVRPLTPELDALPEVISEPVPMSAAQQVSATAYQQTQQLKQCLDASLLKIREEGYSGKGVNEPRVSDNVESWEALRDELTDNLGKINQQIDEMKRAKAHEARFADDEGPSGP